MWFKGGGGGAGITVARAIWYPFQGSIIVLSQHRLLGTGRGGGRGGRGQVQAVQHASYRAGCYKQYIHCGMECCA